MSNYQLQEQLPSNANVHREADGADEEEMKKIILQMEGVGDHVAVQAARQQISAKQGLQSWGMTKQLPVKTYGINGGGFVNKQRNRILVKQTLRKQQESVRDKVDCTFSGDDNQFQRRQSQNSQQYKRPPIPKTLDQLYSQEINASDFNFYDQMMGDSGMNQIKIVAKKKNRNGAESQRANNQGQSQPLSFRESLGQSIVSSQIGQRSRKSAAGGVNLFQVSARQRRFGQEISRNQSNKTNFRATKTQRTSKRVLNNDIDFHMQDSSNNFQLNQISNNLNKMRTKSSKRLIQSSLKYNINQASGQLSRINSLHDSGPVSPRNDEVIIQNPAPQRGSNPQFEQHMLLSSTVSPRSSTGENIFSARDIQTQHIQSSTPRGGIVTSPSTSNMGHLNTMRNLKSARPTMNPTGNASHLNRSSKLKSNQSIQHQKKVPASPNQQESSGNLENKVKELKVSSEQIQAENDTELVKIQDKNAALTPPKEEIPQQTANINHDQIVNLLTFNQDVQVQQMPTSQGNFHQKSSEHLLFEPQAFESKMKRAQSGNNRYVQKSYKIPSIANCLKNQILPKNSRIMKDICISLAKNPSAKIEEQSTWQNQNQNYQQAMQNQATANFNLVNADNSDLKVYSFSKDFKFPTNVQSPKDYASFSQIPITNLNFEEQNSKSTNFGMQGQFNGAKSMTDLNVGGKFGLMTSISQNNDLRKQEFFKSSSMSAAKFGNTQTMFYKQTGVVNDANTQTGAGPSEPALTPATPGSQEKLSTSMMGETPFIKQARYNVNVLKKLQEAGGKSQRSQPDEQYDGLSDFEKDENNNHIKGARIQDPQKAWKQDLPPQLKQTLNTNTINSSSSYKQSILTAHKYGKQLKTVGQKSLLQREKTTSQPKRIPVKVNVNIDYISKANLKQDKDKDNEPNTAVFRSPGRKERGTGNGGLAPKGVMGSPSTQKSLAGMYNGGSVQGRNTLLNEQNQRSIQSGHVYSSGRQAKPVNVQSPGMEASPKKGELNLDLDNAQRLITYSSAADNFYDETNGYPKRAHKSKKKSDRSKIGLASTLAKNSEVTAFKQRYEPSLGEDVKSQQVQILSLNSPNQQLPISRSDDELSPKKFSYMNSTKDQQIQAEIESGLTPSGSMPVFSQKQSNPALQGSQKQITNNQESKNTGSSGHIKKLSKSNLNDNSTKLGKMINENSEEQIIFQQESSGKDNDSIGPKTEQMIVTGQNPPMSPFENRKLKQRPFQKPSQKQLFLLALPTHDPEKNVNSREQAAEFGRDERDEKNQTLAFDSHTVHTQHKDATPKSNQMILTERMSLSSKQRANNFKLAQGQALDGSFGEPQITSAVVYKQHADLQHNSNLQVSSVRNSIDVSKDQQDNCYAEPKLINILTGGEQVEREKGVNYGYGGGYVHDQKYTAHDRLYSAKLHQCHLRLDECRCEQSKHQYNRLLQQQRKAQEALEKPQFEGFDYNPADETLPIQKTNKLVHNQFPLARNQLTQRSPPGQQKKLKNDGKGMKNQFIKMNTAKVTQLHSTQSFRSSRQHTYRLSKRQSARASDISNQIMFDQIKELENINEHSYLIGSEDKDTQPAQDEVTGIVRGSFSVRQQGMKPIKVTEYDLDRKMPKNPKEAGVVTEFQIQNNFSPNRRPTFKNQQLSTNNHTHQSTNNLHKKSTDQRHAVSHLGATIAIMGPKPTKQITHTYLGLSSQPPAQTIDPIQQKSLNQVSARFGPQVKQCIAQKSKSENPKAVKQKKDKITEQRKKVFADMNALSLTMHLEEALRKSQFIVQQASQQLPLELWEELRIQMNQVSKGIEVHMEKHIQDTLVQQQMLVKRPEQGEDFQLPDELAVPMQAEDVDKLFSIYHDLQEFYSNYNEFRQITNEEQSEQMTGERKVAYSRQQHATPRGRLRAFQSTTSIEQTLYAPLSHTAHSRQSGQSPISPLQSIQLKQPSTGNMLNSQQRLQGRPARLQNSDINLQLMSAEGPPIEMGGAALSSGHATIKPQADQKDSVDKAQTQQKLHENEISRAQVQVGLGREKIQVQVTKNHQNTQIVINNQNTQNFQGQNSAQDYFNLHKASELIMNMGNHGIQSGQHSDEPSSPSPAGQILRIDDTYDHASIGENTTKTGMLQDDAQVRRFVLFQQTVKPFKSQLGINPNDKRDLKITSMSIQPRIKSGKKPLAQQHPLNQNSETEAGKARRTKQTLGAFKGISFQARGESNADIVHLNFQLNNEEQLADSQAQDVKMAKRREQKLPNIAEIVGVITQQQLNRNVKHIDLVEQDENLDANLVQNQALMDTLKLQRIQQNILQKSQGLNSTLNGAASSKQNALQNRFSDCTQRPQPIKRRSDNDLYVDLSRPSHAEGHQQHTPLPASSLPKNGVLKQDDLLMSEYRIGQDMEEFQVEDEVSAQKFASSANKKSQASRIIVYSNAHSQYTQNSGNVLAGLNDSTPRQNANLQQFQLENDTRNRQNKMRQSLPLSPTHRIPQDIDNDTNFVISAAGNSSRARRRLLQNRLDTEQSSSPDNGTIQHAQNTIGTEQRQVEKVASFGINLQ